jgi:tetratricopeptide (TPR) repeat protein
MPRPTLARLAVLAVATSAVLSSGARAQRLNLSATLNELEAAVRRDSNDAAAHYNVGLGYWKAKRWSDVERSFRTAIAIEYRFALAHLGLAFLQSARLDALAEQERKSGDTTLVSAAVEERHRLYRRAIMFDPFVDHRLAGAIPRPRRLRGLILIVFWSEYGQALRDLADGKDEQAFRRLDRVVLEHGSQRDTAPPGLLWFHALASVRTNRLDDASQDLEALVKRSERQERDATAWELETNDYRYALGILRQRAGRWDDAERLYRTVLGEDIGLYMARVRLGDVHEERGAWELAIAEREQALALNPEDPTSLLELGVTLGKAGRLAAADSVLRDALARAPRDARPLYYRGLVAVARNRADEARAAFETFIAVAPSRYADRIADARRRLDALP